MSRLTADRVEAGGQTIHIAKPAQELLCQLLDSSLILDEDWEDLTAAMLVAGAMLKSFGLANQPLVFFDCPKAPSKNSIVTRSPPRIVSS
jgi:hypothetical protein